MFEEPPEPMPVQLGPPAAAAPRMIVTRSLRDINGAAAARDRSDKPCWIRSIEIIHKLDEGYSVKEIARAIGLDPRQVRVFRGRLYDMCFRGNTLEISV